MVWCVILHLEKDSERPIDNTLPKEIKSSKSKYTPKEKTMK